MVIKMFLVINKIENELLKIRLEEYEQCRKVKNDE
jgi:hypothetical protein